MGKKILVGVLAVAAALALGFGLLMWFLTAGLTDSGEEPEPLDPALAAGIEQEIAALPGIEDAAVTASVECADRCKSHNLAYRAEVDLEPAATAPQIVEAVSIHRAAALDAFGEEWASHSLPLTVRVDPDRVLTVGVRVGQFEEAHAQAFLDAAEAPQVRARFGGAGQPAFTLTTEVRAPSCDALDTEMEQHLPPLSEAAQTAGIDHVLVDIECDNVSGELAVEAGEAYQPGWSDAVSDLVAATSTGGPPGQAGHSGRILLSFADDQSTITVETRAATIPNELTASLKDAVSQLDALGVAEPQSKIKRI